MGEKEKKERLKLDDEQLSELREIFRSFDRNNDDKNSNGLVEFSEFVALVEPDLVSSKCPYSEEQLKKIFRMFDRDGNGYITAAELAHSMAKLGHALTVEELTGMIKEADTDGDGCINFQEFAQAITSAAFDNSWS
ncbi:hypothetical protein SLA2020_307450 [Shorea laevis]